jgi:hypothetical protein
LFVQQCGIIFERLALIGKLGVFAYLLEASLDCFSGDLLLVALAFDDLRQQPIFAALLLLLFVELLLNRGKLCFDSLNCFLLGYKIARDENRGWNEVGFEPPLSLVVIVLLRPDEFAVLVLDLRISRGCALAFQPSSEMR